MIREVQGSLTFMASGLELAEEIRRADEGAPERRRVAPRDAWGQSARDGRAGGLWGRVLWSPRPTWSRTRIVLGLPQCNSDWSPEEIRPKCIKKNVDRSTVFFFLRREL